MSVPAGWVSGAPRLMDSGITYRTHDLGCVCDTCLPDLAARDRVDEFVPAACACCVPWVEPHYAVCQCLACLEDRVAAQRAHTALTTGSPLYSVLERARREYWIQAVGVGVPAGNPGCPLSER